MADVEIIYSPSYLKILKHKIQYTNNLTVAKCIEMSGLINLYPEISNLAVGIFSKIVNYDYIVQPNDRIEIYRPLIACPKERRRKHAKK